MQAKFHRLDWVMERSYHSSHLISSHLIISDVISSQMSALSFVAASANCALRSDPVCSGCDQLQHTKLSWLKRNSLHRFRRPSTSDTRKFLQWQHGTWYDYSSHRVCYGHERSESINSRKSMSETAQYRHPSNESINRKSLSFIETSTFSDNDLKYEITTTWLSDLKVISYIANSSMTRPTLEA